MTRFFRWQFWRNRSRYWRMKCREVEVRYGKLLIQAEAERWRNYTREDTFASAAVLGAKGMFGLAPRTSPASTQQPQSILQTVAPTMTAIDKMEFDTQWLPFAIQNGISPQQAERDFMKELTQRKAFNDEPSM